MKLKNNKKAIIAIVFLLIGVAKAAYLQAKKMEILFTDSGKVTILKDSVTIIDHNTKITAQNASFWGNTNLAIVSDSVVIQNPSALIKSDTACYYLTERKMILSGNVLVEQESLVIKAPKLVLEYQKDRALAQNGFVVIEKPHHLKITGITGQYFLTKEEGIIDSLPYLEVSQNETLTITAQRLFFSAKAKKAIAQGKVRVNTSRATLSCDSLTYDWVKDSASAHQNPALQENKNSLTGKTIYFSILEGKVKEIKIEGDAWSNYYSETGDKVEIKADVISLSFAEGKANSITVSNVNSGKLYRRSETTLSPKN